MRFLSRSARFSAKSRHTAISRLFVRAIPSLRPRFVVSILALSGASRQGRVAAPSVCYAVACILLAAAPSVCYAVACILLAAAPTAPPCFRHWRRSSPLPQRGSHWRAGPLFAGCLRPDRAQKSGPRLRGQRLLNKSALSSCCESRPQGTTVSDKIKLCLSRVGLTGTPVPLPMGEVSAQQTERACRYRGAGIAQR